jgi:two-component system, OmpR family, sensor histidine kinase SenX3
MSRPAVAAAVFAGLVGGGAGGAAGGVRWMLIGAVAGVVTGLATGLLAERATRRRLADRTAHVGQQLDEERIRQQDRTASWQRDFLERLVSAALLFDRDGYLVAANRAARDLFGLADDDTPRTVIQALGSATLANAVARADRTSGRAEVDAEIRDRQVRAAVSVVGDEILVIVNDRTRERRVEELRRNFVVNASHELKTPATAIQTLSEALEITAVSNPDRVPALVARLREESDRLVRLVHDLLNLRRLEERGELERVSVDMADLAREVATDLQERADERRVALAVHAPDLCRLAGDPEDLRLILRNLVANAIQYNREDGRVDVRVRRDREAVVVEVADTGIGIPQQDIRRIFERFYRVDVARSRQTGGTGLGLSIVRHAVERHHGTIRVVSLLGEGSTFTVTLPVEDR